MWPNPQEIEIYFYVILRLNKVIFNNCMILLKWSHILVLQAIFNEILDPLNHHHFLCLTIRKFNFDEASQSKYRLRPATLLKMRLWHSCLPVKFAKLLWTLFLQNTFVWLLLNVQFHYLYNIFLDSLRFIWCHSSTFTFLCSIKKKKTRKQQVSFIVNNCESFI